jgi:hypothetical protein
MLNFQTTPTFWTSILPWYHNVYQDARPCLCFQYVTFACDISRLKRYTADFATKS